MFIDAGYLLAGAGSLYLGTSTRSEVRCDAAAVTHALLGFARERSGLRPLRLYWYDAAPNAVPMSDHIEIAHLPRVKVRLGRLIRGEQKGVDSLLIRDLMVLGRERAIAAAFVFGGDEDLREGIIDAQDRGIAVDVLGFAQNATARPSDALVREADEFVEVPKGLLEGCFSYQSGDVRLVPKESANQIIASSSNDADALGRAFARAWAQTASQSELHRLLTERPLLPRSLDIQLITEAERCLGSLREDEESRILLRRAFWEELSRT